MLGFGAAAIHPIMSFSASLTLSRSSSTIFRYLRDPDCVSPVKTMVKIAQALGVSLDYLVGLSEVPYCRSCEDEFCYILYKVYSRATDRDRQIVGMILNHYLTEEEVAMNYDLS